MRERVCVCVCPSVCLPRYGWQCARPCVVVWLCVCVWVWEVCVSVCVRHCVCDFAFRLVCFRVKESWTAFFMHLETLRTDPATPPVVHDLLLRAAASLLHPHRRQALLPLWHSRAVMSQAELLSRLDVALSVWEARLSTPV